MDFMEEFKVASLGVRDIEDIDSNSISNPDGLITRREMMEVMKEFVGSMAQMMQRNYLGFKACHHNTLTIIEVLKTKDIIDEIQVTKPEFDA